MRTVSAVRLGIAAAFITLGALGAIGSGCSSSNGTTSNGDGGTTSEAGAGTDGQTQARFDSGFVGLGNEDSGSDSAVATGDDDNTGDDDSGGNSGDAGDDNSGDSGDDSSLPPPDAGHDAGTDADCKVPSLHVPVPDGGVYCPYSFNDAADAGIKYCANGTEECCLSPGGNAGPSVCQAFDGTGAAFNGGRSGCGAQYDAVWQCSSPSDCRSAGPTFPIDGGAPTSGPLVCCLVGGALESESALCSAYQKTHFGGTTCQPQSACAGSLTIGVFTDPLFTVCEQQSDCTGVSQTCTPIFVTGTPIGVCLPQ